LTQRLKTVYTKSEAVCFKRLKTPFQALRERFSEARERFPKTPGEFMYSNASKNFYESTVPNFSAIPFLQTQFDEDSTPPPAADQPAKPAEPSAQDQQIALLTAQLAEKATSVSNLELTMRKVRDEKTALEKLQTEANKKDMMSKDQYTELIDLHKTESMEAQKALTEKLTNSESLIRKLTIDNEIKNQMGDLVLAPSREFIEFNMKSKLDVNLETGEVFVKNAVGEPDKTFDENKVLVHKNAKHLFAELFADKSLGIHFKAPTAPAGSGASGGNFGGGAAGPGTVEEQFRAAEQNTLKNGNTLGVYDALLSRKST